jgi:hypothetical protein
MRRASGQDEAARWSLSSSSSSSSAGTEAQAQGRSVAAGSEAGSRGRGAAHQLRAGQQPVALGQLLLRSCQLQLQPPRSLADVPGAASPAGAR